MFSANQWSAQLNERDSNICHFHQQNQTSLAWNLMALFWTHWKVCKGGTFGFPVSKAIKEATDWDVRVSAEWQLFNDFTYFERLNVNAYPGVQLTARRGRWRVAYGWCAAEGRLLHMVSIKKGAGRGAHYTQAGTLWMRPLWGVWMWLCKPDSANSNHTLTFKFVFCKDLIILLYIYIYIFIYKHFDRWERVT